LFFEIITAIILAVVQGLTEFLPVSSSGHLAIGAALLGSKGPAGGGSLLFEVAVHVGTLGAVAAVYRRRIRVLCESVLSFASSGFRHGAKHGEGMSYIGLLALGSIPAAAAGILFRDSIAALFDSPDVVSALLVATGIFLLLSRGLSSRGRSGSSPLTPGRVLLIGMAQAVAILPGCSRSGWTITMALLAGIGFETAAEFSFMLSIPAILGALALELMRGGVSLQASSILLLLVPAAVAFVTGLAALKLLVRILRAGALHRFAWYLIPVGVVSWAYFSFISRQGI